MQVLRPSPSFGVAGVVSSRRTFWFGKTVPQAKRDAEFFADALRPVPLVLAIPMAFG